MHPQSEKELELAGNNINALTDLLELWQFRRKRIDSTILSLKTDPAFMPALTGMDRRGKIHRTRTRGKYLDEELAYLQRRIASLQRKEEAIAQGKGALAQAMQSAGIDAPAPALAVNDERKAPTLDLGELRELLINSDLDNDNPHYNTLFRQITTHILDEEQVAEIELAVSKVIQSTRGESMIEDEADIALDDPRENFGNRIDYQPPQRRIVRDGNTLRMARH